MITVNKEKVDCHIWLGSEAIFKGDVLLPPQQTYHLEIDYPLQKSWKFQIKTGKHGLGTNGLVSHIIKIYDKIYKNEDKYLVHKHALDDLYLSSIEVNHCKKTITIGVDS